MAVRIFIAEAARAPIMLVKLLIILEKALDNESVILGDMLI